MRRATLDDWKTGGLAVKVVETERLILRQLSVADAAFMLRLLNEPSFLRYIGDRGVRTLDNARDYILKGPVSSYQRLGFGLYLVELKSDGVAIGICGLVKRESLPDVDVGFAFLPEYWSKGYAVESAAAVLNYARDVAGLKRVVAITSRENAGSISLLKKIGFEFERLITLPGNAEEINLFATAL
jgi:RimJ/RimL family protein N-acetyltransferase